MKIRKIIAIVFALALVVTACGDDDGGNGGDSGDRYSAEIRDGYLQGCESSSPGGNFCECSLEEIEKRFTEEEFIAFAVQATEEPPEEFLEVAFVCLEELDLGN